MEGMKFDAGKARWDLVPNEYFTLLASSIKPFIEMYMVDGFSTDDHLYNVVRSNIARWRDFGANCLTNKNHPLVNSMIGCLMLAKPRKYTVEELNIESLPQRWDLLDPEWTTKIAEVYAHGASKYEENNWKGVSPERYYSALNRHVDDYAAGNTFDNDSGFKHMYHAAWNTITLMWFDDQKVKPIVIMSDVPPEIKRAARRLKGVVELTASKK